MVDNYLRFTPKQFVGYLYYRWALRPLFSAVWVPGSFSRKFMRFLGVPNEDIYEGLYSADTDVFCPPSGMGVRRGVAFVGQLVERKGVLDLAVAVEQLTQAGGDPEVRFIGHGVLRERLLAGGMKVEPFLQAPQLAKVYREVSALILPSKIDHWGVVVHEAALCGCLLIVTRQCGSVAEMVEHGVNGYVMKTSSVAEMAAALRWHQGLSREQIDCGRAESVQRGRMISPARWADTLDTLVGRFATRPLPAAGPVVV
jgi:glycosyltransferase involved in cell wall biosynthesis